MARLGFDYKDVTPSLANAEIIVAYQSENFQVLFRKTVLAAGELITGIQYIQDSDRFLADEEVDWYWATSAANILSPSPIADDEMMIGLSV
jgi:hypothetical protein